MLQCLDTLTHVQWPFVSRTSYLQFASVANVTYPNTYQRFLDAVNVLNFDLSWVLSVGCVFKLDFHDRLLFATLGPIICVAMLGVTYGMAAIRNHGASEALANVQQKHLSATLLLTFFIYSSVSSILFQTFACEKLDDGNIYLRADYRIQCDSPKHEAFTVYAGFMTVLYAFGIPALYTSLLLKDRHVLVNCDGGNNIGSKDARSNNPRVRSTSNLWKPYKPKRFYYEVVECGRRILLTGVVVFIFPDSAAQIAVTLIIALTFAMASEVLDPYASTWDTWMGRMGHVVVFLSVYVALLLKVDVSAERAESQKVFEAILVFVHACMIVAVLVEALVMACSLREEGQEDPFPRFRRMKWIHRTRGRSSAKTGFVTESKTAEVELPVADANVEVERKVVTQSDMEGRGNETKVT